MEIIRNYLETMFANLPNTAEVIKAKNELYSMMEDKYDELISEGKLENEAVGIIISEFGNLEELAETLGIGGVVNNNVDLDTRLITDDEAVEYVFDASQHRLLLGVGVMLFIISPIFPILAGMIGVAIMFVAVAAGIAIVVLSSIRMGKWKFLDNIRCVIDYSTANALYNELRNNSMSKALMMTIGILCIVLSVIPVIIIDELSANIFYGADMAPASLFIMVGIGVMLIITSTAKEGAYNKLLSLNDKKSVSGNYEAVRSVNREYGSEIVDFIMPNYWKIVTCIYLIWSFLSFDWGRTWLIWPIAGIVNKIIASSNNNKGDRNK